MEIVGIEKKIYKRCEFVYILDSEETGPDVIWMVKNYRWFSLKKGILKDVDYNQMHVSFGIVIKVKDGFGTCISYDDKLNGKISEDFPGTMDTKYILKDKSLIKKWYLKLQEEKIMIKFWKTDLDIKYQYTS